MAFFTTERTGFSNVMALTKSVVDDMIANGFNVIFPVGYNTSTPVTVPAKFVLEASSTVDPLATTQPWRVCFEVSDKEIVAAYVATPQQIYDDGSVESVRDTDGKVVGKTGATGSLAPTVKADDTTTGFINRKTRVGAAVSATGSAYPLNYRLTISDHGFFLGCYEGNWANVIYNNTINTYFTWLLVQRPVNKTTGAPLVVGKCPLFCVNKVDSKYWKFVVRESDSPHPTPPVPADSHTSDSFKIINTKNQSAITEDKKYLVSFLNNLNTPRFRYTEELDLLAYTSADVIMGTTPASMTVYGGTREYTALHGSDDFNTGVKFLVLTKLPTPPAV